MDLPESIAPMLATLGEPSAEPGQAIEFKWDGIRCVSFAEGGGVRLQTRNGNDVTAAYPELAGLPDVVGDRPVVLDGEIVALDEAGRPSFARLQQRMHVADPSPALVAAVPVVYYVFDVLHLGGVSTMPLPYADRRDLLTGLALSSDEVRVPPHFVDADPQAILTAAQAQGLEGIVVKRLGSAYQPGRRSPSWIKVPISLTQEVVIVGWKPGQGRRAGTIGSLLTAVAGPDGRLSFAGGVGTGFTHQMLGHLQDVLRPYARGTAPVPGIPREFARGAHWVEPLFVGEVAYRNWTPDGRLRHPSWRGLRPDKTPAQAVRDLAAAQTLVKGLMVTPDGGWRVEVVSRHGVESFRIVHGDNVVEGLDLAGVEKVLGAQGIDLRSLEAGPAA
ncbi:non-homologous end-joining DNA ligase [Nucisporomicrobium flavum]|uniref:non-homologous end-joining DNA ligase n=1 Tax=Nucisporomicrobium flavum TaxID=2785915 RepID=UPI0018F58052|nr:non-homologous end-joining DNA ligase [Nucisporomicrobium flavum]